MVAAAAVLLQLVIPQEPVSAEAQAVARRVTEQEMQAPQSEQLLNQVVQLVD